MEGHPIPQDITGFQFKLIGDMTIKQFAYLACGAVLAWIFYSLPLPGLIKIPISAFFALLGIGFAFIPISGRPMDTMAYNFIKALLSPSVYFYKKTGGELFAQASQSTKPVEFIATIKKPATEEDKTPTFVQTQAPHIIAENVDGEKKAEEKLPSAAGGDEEEVQEKEENLAQEEQTIKKELQEAKTQEAAAVNTPSAQDMHQKVLELERQLSETASQRQELERQILSLQQKLNNQNQNTYTPSTAVPKRETKNVRSIPSGMSRSVGVPIVPDFPNLLTGIVKDPRGNPLPNILVEVKDKEGNPVRAFKTNGLGQFASATALTNGVYNVVFEDPKGQNKFDTVEIGATGEIILPLEIISQDAREELRKSLFSAQGGSASGGS